MAVVDAEVGALDRKISNAKASLAHYQDKVRDSKIEAERILDQAKAQAEQCKAAAYQVAKDVHAEIAAERTRMAEFVSAKHNEAETVVYNARVEAKRIVTEANTSVNALRREVNNLEADKVKMTSECAALSDEVSVLQAKKTEVVKILAALRHKLQ